MKPATTDTPRPPSNLGPAAVPTSDVGGLPVVLGLVTAVQALATFTVLALPSVAPKAAETFGLQPQFLGYQISLVYGAGAVLSCYAGVLVRRFGAGSVTVVATAVCALGLLGLASGNIALTALASLLIGAGYGITNPAATHLLVKVTPDHRRNVIFAIKQAGVPFGGMLASLLLPWLSVQIGWQWAIALSVLLFVSVAMPLLARRTRWDGDRDHGAPIAGAGLLGIRAIVAEPTLIALSVLGFCYAGYQFTLLAFAVTMLVAELGWTLVGAGLVAAAMQVAGIAGRIGWSVLADGTRAGLAVLAGIGLSTIALGGAVAGMEPGWSTLAVTALLSALSFCAVGWNGVYMAEAARAAGPARAGLATGGLLVFNFSGVIVCPALYALASKTNGAYAINLAWFTLLPLIGAGAATVALRRERQRGRA